MLCRGYAESVYFLNIFNKKMFALNVLYLSVLMAFGGAKICLNLI